MAEPSPKRVCLEEPLTMMSEIQAAVSNLPEDVDSAWMKKPTDELLTSFQLSLKETEEGVLEAPDSFATIVEKLQKVYKTIAELRGEWSTPPQTLELIYQTFTLMMAPRMSAILFCFYETLLSGLLQNSLSAAEASINQVMATFVNDTDGATPRGRDGVNFATLLRRPKAKAREEVVVDDSIVETGWFPAPEGGYTSAELARALVINNVDKVKKLLDNVYALTTFVVKHVRGPYDSFTATRLTDGVVSHDVNKTVKSNCIGATFSHKVVLRITTESRNNNEVLVVRDSDKLLRRFGPKLPAAQGSISVPRYKKMTVLEMPSARLNSGNIQTKDTWQFALVDHIDFFMKDGYFNQKVWPLRMGLSEEKVSLVSAPTPCEGDRRSYESVA